MKVSGSSLCAALWVASLTAPALLAPTALLAEPVRLDAQHQRLATLAGHWSVTQALWMGDAKTPKIDKGEADLTMTLNSRHLRQTLRIDDGTHFEGLGYIGYDPARAQFFSTWMDVNFPGLIVAYGTFDEATKTYALYGSMSGDSPGAAPVPVREVLTLATKDRFSYAYYETRQGEEKLTVRLDYSRLP